MIRTFCRVAFSIVFLSVAVGVTILKYASLVVKHGAISDCQFIILFEGNVTSLKDSCCVQSQQL